MRVMGSEVGIYSTIITWNYESNGKGSRDLFYYNYQKGSMGFCHQQMTKKCIKQGEAIFRSFDKWFD